jgi:S-adenosylmethionine:tRNA ribosyltransferase-isomerase
MKLSQFKFKLPEELVALEPPYRAFENEDGTVDKLYRRDECRLMVVHRKSQTIDLFKKDAEGNDTEEYLIFRDLVNYFDEGDTFIFNDTKVFPARLFGTKEKTDAKIEVFLLRELNEELRLWDVLVEPARKIRIGNKLFFDEDGPMVAEVIDNTTSRGRTLRFLYDCPHDEFKKELFALGAAPLPRYIIDRRDATPEDMENFQTIYAKNEGAVTAPSSGLHFSREMLKRLEIRGVNFAFITVHCSLGNFEGIEVEDLTKHKMSSEQMIISAEACNIVNEAKQNGRNICAVGVSTARATETAVGTDGLLKEYDGWTNKFIFPPYEFGVANSMVANFYHPESTMLMSAAAFGGYDIVMEGYKLALKHEYKFGCYGDAMLILDD